MTHVAIKGTAGFIMLSVSDEGETTINPGYHHGLPATYVNFLGKDLDHLITYAKDESRLSVCKVGDMQFSIIDTDEGHLVELHRQGVVVEHHVITREGFKDFLLKKLI